MRIGVDIDEVTLDMNTALRAFYKEKYGISLAKEDFKSYDLSQALKCTKEEENKIINEFYDSIYFRDMLPVEGAVEGIEQLLARHDELIVLTSRYAKGKNLTQYQIDKYFYKKFSGIYFTKDSLKKHELCKLHKVEVLIEDCIEISIPCAQNGTRIILLDYPWNQHEEVNGITRVKSWKEIIDKM